MMKLSVEITPSGPKVGTDAVARLLYALGDELRSPGFALLQGPPHARAVLASRTVVDHETSSILIGELVTAPHQPGGK
jgi:hypothetical protein